MWTDRGSCPLARGDDQTLIDDNVRTGDLGGNATTHAITEAILQRLA